jgi:hypothetical protein
MPKLMKRTLSARKMAIARSSLVTMRKLTLMISKDILLDVIVYVRLPKFLSWTESLVTIAFLYTSISWKHLHDLYDYLFVSTLFEIATTMALSIAGT